MVSPPSRFLRERHETLDDGWSSADEAAQPLTTSITVEQSRSALSWNDSPDLGFDRSVNPYRGCEHGCMYCYARPSHARLGLSPGLDFESRLWVKPEVPLRLRDELARPSYRCEVIVLGSNTDCYQPIERSHRITRALLELAEECRHPVAIITKSALVLRDLDILSRLSRQRLARVLISLTTLDRTLARRMEPRAATPERRVETIQRLAAAGVAVGVLCAPMIPGLNDRELEALLRTARTAGAETAGYVMLRLPYELKDMVRGWLETHYPDRAGHVLSLIRQVRDGALTGSDFATRMSGTGPVAELLAQRFALAHRRLGFATHPVALDTHQFRAPHRLTSQLGLFAEGHSPESAGS